MKRRLRLRTLLQQMRKETLQRTVVVIWARHVYRAYSTPWWRGRLECGFSLAPFFAHSKPKTLYGGAFEPVVLRWNSLRVMGGMAPTSNLPGAGCGLM